MKSNRVSALRFAAVGDRSNVIKKAAETVALQALESRQLLAATLPAGFEETDFISGLNGATSMELAPDGRIFVSEKFGSIRVVKNGQLLETPAITIDVDTYRDRGVSGITLDPNFASNGYLYAHYTEAVPNNRDTEQNGAVNRVSRFTVVGDTINPNSEVVLIDNVPSTNGFHCGGFLDFGNDGKLYIGFGTPAPSDGPQNLNNYIGKILRINPDGTAPSDNPYYGQPNAKGAIWAIGLRNPFSGAIDPVTGKIFVNDVGEFNWEEVNEIQKGKNYGWPSAEGNSPNPAYTDPVYTYAHTAQFNGEAAVTGGVFYRGNAFPSQYAGDYFFADYDQGYLRVRDAQTGQVSIFGENLFRPVDLDIAADGNLYYLSVWGGSIQKISHVGVTNRAPEAVASANPTSGTKPLIVNFSGNGSSDPDGDSLTYTWDFGDGTSAVAKNPAHTYSNNGQYVVTLTVSDGKGGSDESEPITITVGNHAPTGTITSPTAGAKYNGGTTINFGGTGSDVQDGSLPASAFEWKIDFHHNTHMHGFINSIPGVKSGSFLIPTTGEIAANQWYRIYLTVTDSGGLTHTSFTDVNPNVSTIGLTTNISGLTINLDDQPKVAPHSFDGVVGMLRTLGAPPTQTLNGRTYEFVSWSDGGAATHDIDTPATNTTYTATYRDVSGGENTIPGTIQIEDFDAGANNVAYRDLDTANQGGAYRDTRVDIQSTSDAGGGYNVGWTKAGEWLRYTVDVEESGTYTVDFRVASKVLGGTFHLEVDGVNVTGTMQVPNTGAHQTFATISKTGVNLAAGTRTLRLVMDSNNANGIVGNFNWMRFTQDAPANQAPIVSITSPANLSNFPADQNDIVIVASASDPDGSIAKVEFYVDGNYVGADMAGIYDTTAENLAAGQHILTAIAFDNLGKTTTSSPIMITIASAGNQLPTVAITSHTNGQNLTAGTTQVIVANATDPDGTLTKVEFYVDGTLIGTDLGGDFDNDWLNIPAGQHVLTAKAYDNAGGVTTSAPITVNVAQAGQSPFSGSPIALPGLIEAENFDNGGQGVSFNDTTSANQGGAYRSTRVDIQSSSDTGGGYQVGYTKTGEWLEYTVTIAQSGTYTFDTRVSSKALGGTFHMELDGVNVTGTLQVPNTAAWTTYQTVSKTGLNLTAGTYVMRIAMDSQSATTGYVGNFNWFRFTKN